MTETLPATLPEISAQIAEIERAMPTRAYRQDEGLQERYRALVGRRSELEKPALAVADDDMFEIPSGVNLEQARAVGDVLLQTPPDERRQLFDSFGELSEDVRALMAAELTSRKFAAPVPFTDEVIADVQSEPAMKMLAGEWGGLFAQKLSIAEGRFARLFAEFDKYERGDLGIKAVTAWMLALPPGAQAAIYRRLAA